MAARRLRIALALACLVLASGVSVFAQGAPLTVGPVTVTVPPGWTGEVNGVPARIFSPDSNPQWNFSVEFFPPEETPEDIAQHHAAIWGRMAATFRVAAPPQSGLVGQFIRTRSDQPRGLGQRETFILYSAKKGTVYIGVAVHGNRPDLVSRNLPAIEAMLSRAVWNNGSSGSSNYNTNATYPGVAQTSAGGPATLGDYVYATPPGWRATQYPDGIVLAAPISNGEACQISMWPMRATSGNLQRDAIGAFQEIFKTYQLRNQTSRGTALPPSMIRGTSGQGWDYLIVKNGITKPGGQYQTLLAFVMVARLENRVAVISGMSKDPLVSTCMGELAGNVWPRFFHSLKFRNWSRTGQAQALGSRLVGAWTAATATAGDQFTFAPNGRYGGTAAAQQYNRISSTEVLRTTQTYSGAGAYTLQENTLTLKPDGGNPETAFFRLEEESNDDGRSWVEALYLLRKSAVDGNDYELRYSKH